MPDRPDKPDQSDIMTEAMHPRAGRGARSKDNA